jgi:hypothetical protein
MSEPGGRIDGGPGGEQATAVALSQVRRQASRVRSAEAP